MRQLTLKHANIYNLFSRFIDLNMDIFHNGSHVGTILYGCCVGQK